MKSLKDKRGIILVACYCLVAVLFILGGAFLFRSITENKFAEIEKTYIQAFYLAEAGVADAIEKLPSSLVTGTLKAGYTYSATITPLPLSPQYYQIVSIGSVSVGAGSIDRSITVIVELDNEFSYAIETEGDLDIRGNVDINPPGSQNENVVLDFEELFGISKEAMKAKATHLYDENTFGAPVDGITWVEVTSGGELVTAGNLQGSGILVVEGDMHISGTEEFDGIIYVIGQLTITGTPTINGTILAESGADIDTTIRGRVTINFDIDEITDALSGQGFLPTEVISWHEA